MTYFKKHYMMTEEAYPYVGKNEKCKYDANKATKVETKAVYSGGKDRPDRMKAALA